MTRSLLTLFALGACALSIALIDGCNNAKCGAGTMLVQKPDGTTVCEIATFPTPLFPCDNGDGGSTIVSQGGRCVSHRQCDPGTTMEGTLPDGTIVCVGTGGTRCAPCTNTDPSKICVTGLVYDWDSDMPINPGGDMLRIGAYDPLQFLTDPKTAPILDTTTSDGCYTFAAFSPPGSGLVAIGVQDPMGTATPKYVINGSAAIVSSGNYKVDVYAVKVTTRDGWQTSSGVDITTHGCMVAKFCDDGVPPPTDRSFTNCKPAHAVTGVQFETGGAPAGMVHYYSDRDTVSKTLTATSALGLSIAPFNPAVGLAPYTGIGGMCNGGMACKFETTNSGSQTNVVFFQDFYSCNTTPGASTCM